MKSLHLFCILLASSFVHAAPNENQTCLVVVLGKTTPTKKNPTGESFISCSGTLIGKHSIATAAHCFDHEVIKAAALCGFVNRTADDVVFTETLQITQFPKISELYKKIKKTNDAFDSSMYDSVIVNTVKDSKYEPVTVISTQDEFLNEFAASGTDINAECFVGGYGGQIRLKSYPIQEFGTHQKSSLEILADPVGGGAALWARQNHFILFNRPDKMEHGDSGGPLFCKKKDGVWALVGINAAINEARKLAKEVYESWSLTASKHFHDLMIQNGNL